MKKGKASLSNFTDCTKQHMKDTGNFSKKKPPISPNYTYSGASKKTK